MFFKSEINKKLLVILTFLFLGAFGFSLDFGIKLARAVTDIDKDYTCLDSDGGLNYSVKGTTNGNHSDICYNEKKWAAGVQYNKKGLLEMYCGKNNEGNQQTLTKEIICKNGCKNGACTDCVGDGCVDVSMNCKQDSDCPAGHRCDLYFTQNSDGECKIPTNKNYDCRDSDDGHDPDVAGSVYYKSRSGEMVEEIDYCLDEDILMEAVCDFNGFAYNGKTYKCPKGCKNAACINENTKADINKNKKECPAPYRTLDKNSKCTWNCGEGTVPGFGTKCVCKIGYKENGQDKDGRLVCKEELFKTDNVTAINFNNVAESLQNGYMEKILENIKETRQVEREEKVKNKYFKKETVVDTDGEVEDDNTAVVNFITYGVDNNTKNLGEGERAAVIFSYKKAFNKLPQTKEELSDAINIANGKWPSKKSEEAEKRAQEQFQKIYKRTADMSSSKDNAAITIMAYGLRQKVENRNLNSEKEGIKTFKAIYKHHPSSTEDWNIMQAITYSGSSR